MICCLATTICLTGCGGGSGGKDEESINPPQAEEYDEEIVDKLDENEYAVEASGDNVESATGSAVSVPSDITNSVDAPTYTDDELAAAYSAFDNALFIGDSRTEGMRMHAGIRNADFFCAKSMTIDRINEGEAVNFGGSDMSIQQVLAAKDYSKVYINVGLNELGWVYIEDYVEEYNNLIALIKSEQPDAAIYLQLLLPVSQEKSDNHSYVNNGQIYWYNTHIIEIAEANDVYFVNADAPLIDANGALLAESTKDGVHLYSEYCIIWAKYLAEISQ